MDSRFEGHLELYGPKYTYSFYGTSSFHANFQCILPCLCNLR